MKIIKSILNYFRKEIKYENELPSEEMLLVNLERCSIDNDKNRLRIWNERSVKEELNLNEKVIMELNIQSFLTGYYNSLLYKKYGYFVLVNKIDTNLGTIALSFKRNNGIFKYSYHIYDLQRLLKGCNEFIGSINNEDLCYMLNECKDYALKRRFLK